MKIIVLLSTYNGECYLREQLDSVLNQNGVDVQILVRDDGSTDSTTMILNEYQSTGRLTWYKGENLGPAQSFMHLLAHAGDVLHIKDENEYLFAFCDQDDVWDNCKLYIAASQIEKYQRIPTFYASQTRSVDSQLRPLFTPKLTPLLTLEESLIYSFVTGCTVVINSALRHYVLKGQMPEKGILHDCWCYMVAQAIGAYIVFDPVAHLSYRQHEHNVIGLRDSPFRVWRLRIRRVLFKSPHIRSRIAACLLRNYKEWMSVESQQVVQRFVEGKSSFFKRLKLLFSHRYITGNVSTTFYFRIALLLNTY